MSGAIVIGARLSALSQIQARAVGAALLEQDPGLNLKYRFSEASGDRSTEPCAAAITARGGFTADLQRALEAGHIDVAVHSWKDLPLRTDCGTSVVGTLARADCRDVLLLRRDVIRQVVDGGLRLLSSSARRRRNLEDFLMWALPVRPRCVQFLPVRGDIETRLAKLLRGDGDALVVAKAAIDRLLAGGVGFERSAAAARAALSACHVVVLPLTVSPAAPAQAALAIEIATGNSQLAARIHAVNHQPSWELVQCERSLAAQLGDDDSPLGITRLRFDYGDVEFVRGEHRGSAIEHVKLYRRGQALPRARNAAAIFDEYSDVRSYQRVQTSRAFCGHFGSGVGLLVARSDALPAQATVSDDTLVWTAGLSTWRKLAQRGVWVNGSDESLGETGGLALRPLFPQVTRWFKLSHEQGHVCEHAKLLPTYRVERTAELPNVEQCTHFFWRSASRLRDYLARYPGLENAWHGCGPGNSWRIARQWLRGDRLQPFLSAAQFHSELLA